MFLNFLKIITNRPIKYIHSYFCTGKNARTSIFTDFSSQANLLLINLKEVISKLQDERNYFNNQVEKLQIKKQQLTILNRKMSKKKMSRRRIKNDNCLVSSRL